MGNKKHSSHIIKSLAILSMVRWYNILVLGLSLYLSAFLVFASNKDILINLADYKIHLNILSMLIIIMGGYIVNSFYDLEKDFINKPKEIIFSTVISKDSGLKMYFYLSLLGIAISLACSRKILIFNIVYAFLLWLYSHKLRKKVFMGELGASLLTIIPFISLMIYYRVFDLSILIFMFYFSSIIFTREIIKKLISFRGDLALGDQSIPIAFGIRKTKLFVTFSMTVSCLIVSCLYPVTLDKLMLLFCSFCILTIVYGYFLVKNARFPKEYKRANLLYKVLIALSMLGLLFLTPFH